MTIMKMFMPSSSPSLIVSRVHIQIHIDERLTSWIDFQFTLATWTRRKKEVFQLFLCTANTLLYQPECSYSPSAIDYAIQSHCAARKMHWTTLNWMNICGTRSIYIYICTQKFNNCLQCFSFYYYPASASELLLKQRLVLFFVRMSYVTSHCTI